MITTGLLKLSRMWLPYSPKGQKNFIINPNKMSPMKPINANDLFTDSRAFLLAKKGIQRRIKH
jgi:hypothetical protein